jgi:hypothetical protein
MTLLQIRIGAGVLALLALLTLRRQRWAYFAFVMLGLAYFPAQAHFHIHVPKCEQLISKAMLLVSVRSYAYIALFAGFYWMSWVQFRRTDARVLWAMLATLLVAALLEVAEGMSGRGVARAARAAVLPCRVRDLVPDAAGALGAALILALWSRLTRKPGYVRLVKKAGAPRKSSAPPRTAVPRAVVPSVPLPLLPIEPAARFVPPPADFSPTPSEPTEEVAPVRKAGPKVDIVQRLRAIDLRAIPQHLLAMLQRLPAMLKRLAGQVWGVIRRRRRAIVIGIALLVLVGAAAYVGLQLLPEPAPPTVAVEPEAPPPPPPPRPLQVEAPGWYEPDYNFTIADRRFIRLTLRPDAVLTFAKYGGREQSGCADARIGQSAVFVRCEVPRVGTVTIDGRFTSRYATSRLDAGVLSASITVTNPRGEVLYRARDSFRWHEPE